MYWQGRGGSTGYDNAVALPARADSDELQQENNKSVAALKGQAVFSIAKVPPLSQPASCTSRSAGIRKDQGLRLASPVMYGSLLRHY